MLATFSTNSTGRAATRRVSHLTGPLCTWSGADTLEEAKRKKVVRSLGQQNWKQESGAPIM